MLHCLLGMVATAAVCAIEPPVFPVVEKSGQDFGQVVIEGEDGDFYLVLLDESTSAGRTPDGPVFGSFAGWECDTVQRNCPPGFVRLPDGNFRGCTGDGTVCDGECYHCGGGLTPAHWCKPQSSSIACIIHANTPAVGCGVEGRVRCTLTRPPGYTGPIPPNKCYCSLTAPVLTGGTCSLIPCTP